MAVTTGNFYLNTTQMQGNAEFIYEYFGSTWTLNAICGMLGNFQKESTINPGIWQNLDQGNLKLGFGLAQWTPATNYIDWAVAQGYETEEQYGQMEPNLERIQYELDNGLQFYRTDAYPITFQQYITSELDPYTLAMAWLNNYERPTNRNQPVRGQNAQMWYSYLSGGEPAPPVNPPHGWGAKKRKNSGFKIWLYKNRG